MANRVHVFSSTQNKFKQKYYETEGWVLWDVANRSQSWH